MLEDQPRHNTELLFLDFIESLGEFLLTDLQLKEIHHNAEPNRAVAEEQVPIGIRCSIHSFLTGSAPHFLGAPRE